MYRQFFETLRAEHGEAQATEMMGRAIYARGTEIGRSFARSARGDLAGLRDAFLGAVPDEGRMFAPKVTRCDAGGLDIDNGTFEAAGFEFSADTWQPGRDGCCHLHIRPGGTRRR